MTTTGQGDEPFQELIHKGATRPAMVGGIPTVALILICIPGILVGLIGFAITKSFWLPLIAILFVVPSLVRINLLTRKDDQRFRAFLIALRLRQSGASLKLWRCVRTYAPYTTRHNANKFEK